MGVAKRAPRDGDGDGDGGLETREKGEEELYDWQVRPLMSPPGRATRVSSRHANLLLSDPSQDFAAGALAAATALTRERAVLARGSSEMTLELKSKRRSTVRMKNLSGRPLGPPGNATAAPCVGSHPGTPTPSFRYVRWPAWRRYVCRLPGPSTLNPPLPALSTTHHPQPTTHNPPPHRHTAPFQISPKSCFRWSASNSPTPQKRSH